MRIYLIRHADPDYANDTITEIGQREAEVLAARLETVGLDRLYTSPLGRAQATAQPTARRLGLIPEVEEWTQELTWTAATAQGTLSLWDYPGEVFRAGPEAAGPDTWHRLPPLDAHDLAARFARLGAHSDAFLTRQGYVRDGRRYRCVRPSTDRIAVFGHGGFGLTWLAHLLEIPLPQMWAGFWLPPSSVSLILMEQQSDEWAIPRCIGLGDTSHLYAAGLSLQPRGLYAQNWECAAA